MQAAGFWSWGVK